MCLYKNLSPCQWRFSIFKCSTRWMLSMYALKVNKLSKSCLVKCVDEGFLFLKQSYKWMISYWVLIMKQTMNKSWCSRFLFRAVRTGWGGGSEFMGKTFQAAQLTHGRFLTIDHSCKIFFLIYAKLNFHRTGM